MNKLDIGRYRWTPEEKAQALDQLLRDVPISAHPKIELELMADYYEAALEANLTWNQRKGLSTGLPTLDQMTLGLAPGELSIIAGATSMGKTALALNVAANVALNRHNVLFVTLEMTKLEITTRFVHVLGDSAEHVQSRVFFQKTDELNWKKVDRLIEAAKRDAGAELVIIDHLHYFTRELANVSEDLGNITKEFKKNAMRHQVPIILLSHTRKSANSHTTETGINDLRGSSYIAQDADIVLMVNRDRDYPDKIAITIEKNRNRYGMAPGTTHYFGFEQTRIVEL